MSLLLDALRKADRERSAQHSPAGLDSYTAEPARSGRGLVIALIILLLVVLLLGAWLLWFLWGEKSAPVTQVPAPVMNANSPAPESHRAEPQAQSQPLAPAEQSAVSVSVSSSSKAAANAAPVEPSMVGEAYLPEDAEAHEQKRGPEEQAPQANLDPAVAELYRHKPVEKSQPQAPAQNATTQNPAPSAPPAQSEPQTKQPPAATANTLAGFPNVGGIRALPLAAQNDIPTLMYGQHNYRLGGDSSIVLNGKTLREGDSLGGGLSVDAIVADGVIMRYRDHHFALKALSSWVNM